MNRPETSPKVLEHISIITSELSEVITVKKMAQFNILNADARTTRKQARIESRILEIASKIANDKYAAKMYSNFHTWEAFRNISTKASARALVPNLVTTMHPFGNCLTMAFECADELRAALEAEGPEYAEYADRVQFVSNNWKQRATSAREYHCITIVRLATHCIVVDAVACATASKVPLGQLFKPPGCSSQGFVYVAIGDARLLVEYEPNEPSFALARPDSGGIFEYDDPYTDIEGGLEGALQNLEYPSVNYHMRGELPSRRKIMVHQTWERRPNDDLAFEELADGQGFVVETCQVHVNFVKRKIAAKYIPYADCLQRPEYASVLKRMRVTKDFTPPKQGLWSAKLKISLVVHDEDRVNEKLVQSLRLMDDVCEKLGMPRGEILRIADTMLDVWTGYDEKNSKKGRPQKGAKGRTAKVAAKQPRMGNNGTGKALRPRTVKKRQAPY